VCVAKDGVFTLFYVLVCTTNNVFSIITILKYSKKKVLEKAFLYLHLFINNCTLSAIAGKDSQDKIAYDVFTGYRYQLLLR
jgi:hypothetical protein